MKSNNLKLSTSRKSLHRLSSRQKNRIRFEINQNFSRYKKLNNVSDIQNNIQDISEPSTSVGCNRSNNFINDIRHERERERDINIENESSSLLPSISDSSDAISSFFNTVSTESSFREQLASCFTDINLTHVQGNRILSLLYERILAFLTCPKMLGRFLIRHEIVLLFLMWRARRIYSF